MNNRKHEYAIPNYVKAVLFLWPLFLLTASYSDSVTMGMNEDQNGVSHLIALGNALEHASADLPTPRINGFGYSSGDIPMAFLVTIQHQTIGVLFGFDSRDFTTEEINQVSLFVQAMLPLLKSSLGSNLQDLIYIGPADLQSNIGDALAIHNLVVGGWMTGNLNLYMQVLVDRVNGPTGGTNDRAQIVLWQSPSSSQYFGTMEINDALSL